MSEQQNSADEALADEWAAALDEQATDESATPAESAQFQELQPDMGDAGSGDVKIDAILDHLHGDFEPGHIVSWPATLIV